MKLLNVRSRDTRLSSRRPSGRAALLAGALSVALLTTAAVALAALPIKGARYSGHTSEHGKAILKVSKDGHTIASSAFTYRPRNCTHHDRLFGNVGTGSSANVSIGATGKFDRHVHNASIADNGKVVGASDLTFSGAFGSGGHSVSGKLTTSHIHFFNGGSCPDFTFAYSASSGHQVVKHHHPRRGVSPSFTG